MKIQKKRLEKRRAELIKGLTECEDLVVEQAEVARFHRLRGKYEAESRFPLELLEEAVKEIEETKSLISKGHKELAEVYLKRLEALADSAGKESGRRKKFMGLVSKFKGLFGKEKEVTQDGLIRNQEEAADWKIFQLEKKIAELSDERVQIMKQFEGKVTECAKWQPDSYEYKIHRQQALRLRSQVANVEKQIVMHANLLESNSKYRAMLETGRTTFEIRNYMPDAAEADLLMKMISDEVVDMNGDMAAFEQNVAEYSDKVDRTLVFDEFTGDADFDRMVQEKRQEGIFEKQSAEHLKTTFSMQASATKQFDDNGKTVLGCEAEKSKGEMA